MKTRGWKWKSKHMWNKQGATLMAQQSNHLSTDILDERASFGNHKCWQTTGTTPQAHVDQRNFGYLGLTRLILNGQDVLAEIISNLSFCWCLWVPDPPPLFPFDCLKVLANGCLSWKSSTKSLNSGRSHHCLMSESGNSKVTTFPSTWQKHCS